MLGFGRRIKNPPGEVSGRGYLELLRSSLNEALELVSAGRVFSLRLSKFYWLAWQFVMTVTGRKAQ
jgi:hypothetical protein